jgi:hypothetical protein
MPEKGMPALRQHYAMLGVADRVEGRYFPFPHNYNLPSRTMMYEWFNKHLKLGQSSPIAEREFTPLTTTELTVWTDQHPKPPCGEEQEVALMRALDADARKQIDALTPRDAPSLAEFRRVVGGAMEVMIGRTIPKPDAIEHEQRSKEDRGAYIELGSLVRWKEHGEEVPVMFLYPKDWKKQVVIWATGRGKAALLDGGKPVAHVQRLLDRGIAVAGVDLFQQGEFLADGEEVKWSRRVKNNREFAGYTLGYNHPRFSHRVHDLLAVIAFASGSDRKPEAIHLVGMSDAAPWVVAAAAIAGERVHRVAVDTGSYRFARITDVRDVNLLPGAVKYGDLPAMLALATPKKLWLAGEGREAPAVVTGAYGAGPKTQITLDTGDSATAADRAVAWLTH